MSLVLFALLVVLVVIVYFAAGYGDPEVSRRCPDCGLPELAVLYPGRVEIASRFRCDACGSEYREGGDGTLVKESE